MQGSCSQTDREINDLGIGYDKGACPRDLALEEGYVSRSNGCPSQQHGSSPSANSRRTKGAFLRSLDTQKDAQDARTTEQEPQPAKRSVAAMLLRVQKSKSRATTEEGTKEGPTHPQGEARLSTETSKFAASEAPAPDGLAVD